MKNSIISKNIIFRSVISLYNSKAKNLVTATQRRNAMIACVDEVLKSSNPNHRGISHLKPIYVAAMMLQSEHILNISFSDYPDKCNSVLGIYAESGEEEGIYYTNAESVTQAIRCYAPNCSTQFAKEVSTILSDMSEVKTVNRNPNLIPVGNGIFDYEHKVLLPFTPDVVFTAKAHTRFNPLAQNPVIQQPDGTPWDIHSWLYELFDGDTEKVDLIFQCLGAALRPHQRWGKALILYSHSKASGKSSVLALARALCGADACANLPLHRLESRFSLAPLLDKPSVVIVGDDNSQIQYYANRRSIKTLCSNDIIHVDRPYRKPVTFRPTEFMIQALSDYPVVEQTAHSMIRRFIFLELPHDFQSEGTVNPFIKNDYLRRKDVLEYLMKYLLVDMPEYYELNIPKYQSPLND